MRRRHLLALGLALPAVARAQAFPSRPLRIIVPFAPGGSGDITARLVGRYMEEHAGQTVVIDNRPGANGIIGTMAVKQSPPDGHTMVLATTSTHTANPALVRDLPYDPEELPVVGSFGSGGSYIMVRQEAPWRSFPEFIEAARRQPGQIFFGHFNASSRVPGELLNKFANVQMQHVPYRAIGTAFTDLMAGRIHMIVVDTAAGDAYLRSGCRALAHSRPERWDRFPDMPAVAEFYPDFVLTGFLGLAVPRGTPQEAMQRLNQLVLEAVQAQPMRGRLEEFGFLLTLFDLDACARHVREERAKWSRFVRIAGIEPE